VSRQMVEVRDQTALIVPGQGPYFERIKSIMTRAAVNESQAKDRVALLTDKLKDMASAVKVAETAVERASAEAVAQAKRAAEVAKQAAFAKAELDAKQAQEHIVNSQLSAAEAMAKMRAKQVQELEKAELMLPSDISGRRARNDAQKAASAAYAEVEELRATKEQASRDVAGALAAFHQAKEVADREELSTKPVLVEAELKAKLELQDALEADAAAKRAVADAKDEALQAGRDASMQGPEEVLREEASLQARQLAEGAQAAMAAYAEAQQKARVASANIRAGEEAAILAIKMEAKLKAGIV